MEKTLKRDIKYCIHGADADFCCQCHYGKIRESNGGTSVKDAVDLIKENHMNFYGLRKPRWC